MSSTHDNALHFYKLFFRQERRGEDALAKIIGRQNYGTLALSITEVQKSDAIHFHTTEKEFSKRAELVIRDAHSYHVTKGDDDDDFTFEYEGFFSLRTASDPSKNPLVEFKQADYGHDLQFAMRALSIWTKRAFLYRKKKKIRLHPAVLALKKNGQEEFEYDDNNEEQRDMASEIDRDTDRNSTDSETTKESDSD